MSTDSDTTITLSHLHLLLQQKPLPFHLWKDRLRSASHCKLRSVLRTLYKCDGRSPLVFSQKINSFSLLQFLIQFFSSFIPHCPTSSQPPSFITLPINLSFKTLVIPYTQWSVWYVSLHILCSYAWHSFLIAKQSNIALLIFSVLYPGFSLCLCSFSPNNPNTFVKLHWLDSWKRS